MRQTYLNDPNPSYKQPRGTKSQAIEWLTLEKAVLVARVHRYRQPGYNTTKYDPKYLLDWERGEILRPVSVRAGNHLCGYCYERGNIANWNPGIDQAIEQQK